MLRLDDLLRISHIHESRILYAVEQMKELFPFAEVKVEAMPFKQSASIEMFISRFWKLQYLMGTKLFPLILRQIKEPIEGMSMIERVNKLEKLNVIPSAAEWFNIRDLLNHASHEYSDNPHLTADYLNALYNAVPTLLDYFHRVKAYAAKIKALSS